MSQPFKLRHQNEIVGTLVIGSVFVIIAALIIVVQGKGWFTDYVTISIEFEERSIALIKPGTKVRMRSNVIGRVTDSSMTPDQGVRVDVDIEEDFLVNLTVDSEVMLYLPIAGVGGPSFIEIRPRYAKEAIEPGHVFKGKAAPDLLQLATNLLQDVHALVMNTKDRLGPTLDEIEELARRTNRILKIFDGDIDKEDVASLSATVRETLGRLDKLLSSTQVTVEGFGRVISKADEGNGLIAKTLNDANLYNTVTTTLTRVEALTTQVESLVSKADQASTELPSIAANGSQALKDMLVVSKELKRLAPMLPTMISEIDQLLFESRAMLRAAQETWLIGDVLQNEIDLGLRMPGGLRDEPRESSSAPTVEPSGSQPRAER